MPGYSQCEGLGLAPPSRADCLLPQPGWLAGCMAGWLAAYPPTTLVTTDRLVSRRQRRYSLGSAPAHFGFQQEWSVLVDPPALTPVLTAIFGEHAGGPHIHCNCLQRILIENITLT